MDYQVTIAPAHEPVSLEQARRHLHIEHRDDDALIWSYLTAARAWCEPYVNRALLWQTVTAKCDDFAREQIDLPLGPLVSISSVTYVDVAGATQTVSPALYSADTTAEPGKIVLAYNQTWPSTRGYHHDVTLTYVAGHAKSCTRGGDTLVVNGHLFRINDLVQVYNVGGALPAGLTTETDYYVRTVAGHALGLGLTEGGDAVGIADAGTGTHYIDALPQNYHNGILLRLTDLWVNRGDQDAPPSRAIRELLGLGRMIPV